MRGWMVASLAMIAAGVGVRGTSVHAQPGEPAYVGKWAEKLEDCRTEPAPIITTRSMKLLENGFCRFNRVSGRGANRWHVLMTCSGEGSTDREEADFQVSGNTLRIKYKSSDSSWTVKRCSGGGHVESTRPTGDLKEFTGKWAHSTADCKAELSGKPYNVLKYNFVIGICGDQMEFLRQPASCKVSNSVKERDSVTFSAACEQKDYPRDKPITTTLRVKDANSISFTDERLIFNGEYHRCSGSYKCVRIFDKK